MLLIAVSELSMTKFKFDGGGFGAFLWLSVLEMKNFPVVLNLHCWQKWSEPIPSASWP